MSALGRLLGSEERALNLIRATGLEPFLTRCVKWLNRRFTR